MNEVTTRDATAAERDGARQLLAAAKYLKEAEDESAFADVWAENATLVIYSNGRQIGPLVGRAAIMAFYGVNWAKGAHGAGVNRETHVFENPYIVGMNDGCLKAIHSAIFAAMEGDTPGLVGFGEFQDVLIEEHGRWRILSRISHLRRRAAPSA